MIIVRKIMLYFFKGATAYEFQLWRFGARWVHLSSGGYYHRFKPWRRLSFQWFDKNGNSYHE